jgi:hypothetical protein
MSKITSKAIQEFIDEKLNPRFFSIYVPSQISAYNILNFTISVDLFDERINQSMSETQKAQLNAENKLVEEEMDTDKLYNMLRKELNPTTVGILVNKLLKNEEQIIPRLFEDLKRSGNDHFVEGAARLLIKSEKNYSRELEEILPQIKYPYTKAVMCFVLGKIGTEEQIELIYKMFVSFKKDYRYENYFEGPLIGLYEMRQRYEF